MNAFLAVIATTLLVAPLGPGSVSLPDLTPYIESAINSSFSYGLMIFGALIGVAAVGIGFRFGLGLINWVGNVIGNAFGSMRG